MALDPVSVFIIFLIFLVLYASYLLNKAKNNIYCMFIKYDGTWVNKWVKPKLTQVDFAGGWYYLNKKLLISKVLDTGVYKLFPTKVDAQIFTQGDPDPMNPYNFTIASLTPEARKALDKTEDIAALYQGNRASLQAGRKKGLLEGMMPIVQVITVVAIGYILYILDKVGMSINVLQQMMLEMK